MQDRLAELTARAAAELATTGRAGLEDWRLRYLGRSGELTTLLRQIGKLPPSERPEAGRAANTARDRLASDLEERSRELARSGLEPLDVTMPGIAPRAGGLHPVTATINEIRQILARIGFRSVASSEVESDDYNFSKLNIPEGHPARDMWDTFFIDAPGYPGRMLLRTHTSPAQARVMEQVPPPVRIIVPGKVFRYEDVDASHEAMFHQVEGLAIDTGITMADLRGTLEFCVRSMFGHERKVRIRGSYFPFTEPSCEADMSCPFCKQRGCRVCGNSGWVELLGAGMVHPNVLAKVGYDPDRYCGFAFGMGVERIAMIRHGIDDIRHFYRNDLRFLRQFAAI